MNKEELEKCLNYYKLGDTAEEFEELFGNTPIDDIEKIKKYIFQNYIPKQVILDKIEELRNENKEIEEKPRLCELPSKLINKILENKDKIDVLQEILDKGDN